ncbi:MAG TPA: zinc-ribbon domain-containing protein, partial [Polyangiaceae bacterium]|nr:zinc-ribbon domain-containing protein [Polyangiaceae bacterium]
MDVTCDRCNTRYEFDAALVSNRGTTVKCTNCGHQFKVFRPSELASLDGWTIRTLDGRELTFRAMRELQAAISNGDVSTEDVLLPGDNSEPRRLGKIEELRSFFGEPEDAHTEKRPARTESAPTIEHDIGLVKTNALGSYPGARPPTASAGSPVRRDREGNPMPSRTGTTLPPPTKAPPSRPAPPPRPRFKQSSDDDELLRPDAPTRERLPPEPPTLKGELPVRKVLERLGEAPPSYPGKPAARDKPSDGKIQAVDALNNAVQAMFAGAPSSGAALGQADLIESNWEESTQPRAFGKREESPSLSDEDTLGDNDRQGAMPPPVAVPNEPPQQLSPQQPSIIFEGDSVPPPTPSFTPSVARPSILRRSEVYSDPRFTTYGPRGGQRSMVRWVVGLMSLGLLGVVGFTLFKRYVQPTAKPEASAVKEDERVTKFLEEGDARLFAGDVEGAKDLYTKASGIAENDARVAQSLARVEVIRADLLWLHMRLLEDDAPNRAIVAQQLARAVARAEQAEKTLAERAPRDSSSVGMKIDILRLKGKGNDARKLTSSLKDGGADGGRVLAALDLIESSPNYRKVIDRLRAATKSERKLGRAHAMLIYA